ncbi:MAG: type II toxin-antitoxin system HicB family antitoxin [Catenulispora sp.]
MTVPELRGVLAQGRTYDHAKAMARDAIATMLDIAADRVGVTMEIRLPDHAKPPKAR